MAVSIVYIHFIFDENFVISINNIFRYFKII